MSDRTVTLSDGSVWRFSLTHGLWFQEGRITGYPVPWNINGPILTAADHRAIANALDPAGAGPTREQVAGAIRRATMIEGEPMFSLDKYDEIAAAVLALYPPTGTER